MDPDELEMERLLGADSSSLKETFVQRDAKTRTVTEQLAATIQMCRERNLQEHEVLWNAALFINLASQDLSVAVQGLAFTKDDWHRRYHARQIAMIIYEITEDLTAIFGGSFRKALRDLGVLDRYSADLGKVKKPLDEFWQRHREALQTVRIVTTAHRDHDGLKLLNEIEGLKWCEVLSRGMEFNRIMDAIAKALMSILDATASVPPPRRV